MGWTVGFELKPASARDAESRLSLEMQHRLVAKVELRNDRIGIFSAPASYLTSGGLALALVSPGRGSSGGKAKDRPPPSARGARKGARVSRRFS